ncbi:MAG: hypothetical protein K2X27_15290 [Candidatus Obscuribacterales bacterium]|nr:hypothetical protein [Candidatus Obscuribacterales bacterium]
MSDNPRSVPGTYALKDLDWQNAFGSPDSRPAKLLLQDALAELDKVQSPAFHAMKQNFKEIDLDGDGFLNSAEISFAAKSDNELSALAGNKAAQDDIAKLVNDGRADNRGISIRDLQAFGARDIAQNHAKNDPAELKLAAEFLDKYFKKVDRSKDGFLSRDDLHQLIGDPSLKSSYRQRFLLIDRYFEQISQQYKDRFLKSREPSGISQNDLRTLISNDGKVYRR